MITVAYTPGFVRQYKKLPADLQAEVKEKILLFQKNPRNPSLKFHKLEGRLQKYWSFSANYSYRIIVEEENAPDTYALLAVGDHDIYK